MRFRSLGTIVVTLLAATVASVALQSSGKKAAAVKATEQAPLIQSIKGADLYRAYCASCHGTDAKGGGPMAASLKTKPSDLTQISVHNSGNFPMMRMERFISGEELPASGHGSSDMPVWGPIFSQVTNDVDLGRVRVDNLARYLASIQTSIKK